MNIRFTSLIILILTSLLFASCKNQSSNPLENEDTAGIIDADDPNIQYVGRFNRSNPKKAIFDWSGVYISAKFEGTSCAIRLSDGNNYYAITIDNNDPLTLKTDTSTIYKVASELKDTIHTIIIHKRTEAFIGYGEFHGFILDEGKKLVKQDSLTNRRIEIIGNSITCGYGVEGENANSPFKPETENAALSYAAIIGRTLNADYAMISYSGKGVVRNYGDANKTSADPMPLFYDRTCYYDSTTTWDFSSWIPQAVIINLGTNDFSTQPYPDKSVFQDAYTQLINKVQSQYPGVSVFCLCGPMIGEPCSDYINEVVNSFQNTSNNKVYFINIENNKLSLSDWGSDWHPNITGQQKMADVILPVIKEKMNW